MSLLGNFGPRRDRIPGLSAKHQSRSLSGTLPTAPLWPKDTPFAGSSRRSTASFKSVEGVLGPTLAIYHKGMKTQPLGARSSQVYHRHRASKTPKGTKG